ncbi:acyltransferase [Ruminococcus sp. HUN007]|uniref:acyltransferase family protein n=1 Tax=Ruminococcus sp. HUN007 TaxID=1514668 RepID=UPI0005D19A95|nr:acyltransferase [Ruminococcus sp. HUN007]
MIKPDFRKIIKNTVKPEEKVSSGFTLVSKYRSAIMGFAALWILYFHVFGTVITMDHPIAAWIEARAKRFGYCGVDIFFLLSGMGLTYAITKSKLPVFYYRRFKRIVLPFVTVALLKAHTDHWTVKWFFECISGKAFYVNSIYMFLWFVPAILTLYILFPLYWLGFRKTGGAFWTVTMILAWFFVILILRDKIRGDLFGFLNRIPVFMLGVLLGDLTKKHRELAFRRRAWLPLFLVFALGIYMLELANFQSYYILVPTSNCFLPTLLCAVSLPFLAAKFLNILDSHRFTCIAGHIIGGILKFFGMFSMEIYCLQEWFAGQVRPKFEEQGWTPLKMNIVLFIEITALSFAGYLVFKYFWKLLEFICRKTGGLIKRAVRHSA